MSWGTRFVLRVRARNRSQRSLIRSIYKYTTGVVYSVKAWLKIRPPTIAMPSGRRSSRSRAQANRKWHVTEQCRHGCHIIIGRNRNRQASKMASSDVLPCRAAAIAKSIIIIAFFLTTPINRMIPISKTTFNSL